MAQLPATTGFFCLIFLSDLFVTDILCDRDREVEIMFSKRKVTLRFCGLVYEMKPKIHTCKTHQD